MEKDIRQSLQEHIFRLENRRRELMRPEYLRLGLTIGQRTLDRLAEKGLLERRINPQSRRECQIFLTEEGRKTAAEVCSCFRETEKKMCSGLTEKELEALDAGICRMLGNLTEA